MPDFWTDLGNAEFRLADGQEFDSEDRSSVAHRPVWLLYRSFGEQSDYRTIFYPSAAQQAQLAFAFVDATNGEYAVQFDTHPQAKSGTRITVVPSGESYSDDEIIQQGETLNTWLVTTCLARLAFQRHIS